MLLRATGASWQMCLLFVDTRSSERALRCGGYGRDWTVLRKNVQETSDLGGGGEQRGRREQDRWEWRDAPGWEL